LDKRIGELEIKRIGEGSFSGIAASAVIRREHLDFTTPHENLFRISLPGESTTRDTSLVIERFKQSPKTNL